MIVGNTVDLELPDSAQMIWRHMSLGKLLSLLTTKELFFTPLRLLDDPFEGQLPPLVRERALQAIGHELPDFNNEDHYKYAREHLYVNCWYAGADESAAMWKLYSGDDGIAITSTVGGLSHCLTPCVERITLGKVRYEDFLHFTAGSPPKVRLSHLKRRSFRHEDELRASIFSQEAQEEIRITVDCTCLITQIVLSPLSPEWLVPVVQDVVAKYGFGKYVTKSKLYTLT